LLSVSYDLGLLFHSEQLLLLLAPTPPPVTTPAVGFPTEPPTLPLLVVVKVLASTGNADRIFPGLSQAKQGRETEGTGQIEISVVSPESAYAQLV